MMSSSVLLMSSFGNLESIQSLTSAKTLVIMERMPGVIDLVDIQLYVISITVKVKSIGT